MPENQPTQEGLSPEQEIFRLKEENRVLTEENARLTQKLEQAKAEAGTDELTQLPNRRTLLYNLEIELEKVNRGSRLAVAMIDLDKFKEINDQFGHPQGDNVLVEFSNKIRDQLRGTDTFGRYGGEEFLVLLPLKDNTTLAEVENIFKRYEEITKSINSTGDSEKGGSLTISGGCVIIDNSYPISTTEVIKIVDKNLYHSKNNGRNQFTLTQIPPTDTNSL